MYYLSQIQHIIGKSYYRLGRMARGRGTAGGLACTFDGPDHSANNVPATGSGTLRSVSESHVVVCKIGMEGEGVAE